MILEVYNEIVVLDWGKWKPVLKGTLVPSEPLGTNVTPFSTKGTIPVCYAVLKGGFQPVQIVVSLVVSKYIIKRQQSHKLSHAVSRKNFDDVEKRVWGDRN
jgi:hypothetical protein